MRLIPNAQIPDFTFATPFETELRFSQVLRKVSGKTALVFLRYYGCPICQLDLHRYAQRAEAIDATGGQLLVVLQSDPGLLAEQIGPETFPYTIVCDPEQKLYRMLSIDPAVSMLKMMSLSAVKKGISAVRKGYKHGAYEGNEQQLPAAFILTPDGTVTYAHYGKDAADVPSSDQLIGLLAT